MKRTWSALIGLVVLSAFPLPGQEILQNPDFADGTLHWSGDCKVAGSDSTTDLVTSNTVGKGVLVELRSADWTKVTQEIRDIDKSISGVGLQLTIEYQVSADFKPSDRKDDYEGVGGKIGFGLAPITPAPGQLFALLDCLPESRGADTGAGVMMIYYDKISVVWLRPSINGVQKYTARMTMPPLNGTDNPNFCLAIPPGHGSITITKISLSK